MWVNQERSTTTGDSPGDVSTGFFQFSPVDFVFLRVFFLSKLVRRSSENVEKCPISGDLGFLSLAAGVLDSKPRGWP